MSARILHYEWYTDPPWESVIRDWLVRYTEAVRGGTPFAAGGPAMEMVPVPRALLTHIETSLSQPEAIPSKDEASSVERLTQREISRSHPELIGIIRGIAAALESGQVTEVLRHVSPNYHDTLNRDVDRMRADVEKLGREIRKLRVVPLKAENIALVGDQLIGDLEVAWEGETHGSEGVRYQSGIVRVEVVLERDSDRRWKVGSLRTR